ncbi:MAG: amidohydrolase family protein [Kiritimatiellae bacterium]|nr:amidohydrolase family protein [Kiritimatiellia bacterium]
MLIIANGTIVDGTGSASFPGDVVVEGDRIADVVRGGVATRGDAEVIDARGCLVTPGFVDSHAHSDAYLVLEPDAPSKLSQGVTTEVNGQCGGSAAPRYGEARLSSDWASLLGERLTWRSFAEYRAAVESAHPAINTAVFVGHNTLRSSAMGYAARPAEPDELKRMQRLLEESLDAGAWGLTTGLIYQPGRYSTNEEVVALAKTAAAKGGFYATHMRSEGDAILEAIDEVLDLVRATGIRAEISHLKTSGERNWHKIDAVLGRIERAVADGLLLGSDRYPFCAAGTDLDIVLPDWAQEGAAPAEMARLADPEARTRIVAELDASPRDWSQVMIGGAWHPETRALCGRTIADILAANHEPRITNHEPRTTNHETPGSLVCRILELDRCRTGAFFFGMSEANLDKILAREWIVPGSDASLRAPWGPLGADHPHPRAYGTMPEFYRRLRALGVPREAAVARMTSVPARRFGIRGRGTIERGAFADIAVWSESEFRSPATYTEPHRFAEGMRHVLVNGAVATLGAAARRNAGRLLER